ncbi:hypothetical protein BN59_01535 [Legionella massiliensis]|uniref:Uncharacterized protein n=1 Tax=Legionella massiliensis TaxID=1034943 RepID=A0A078KZP5_9GAMM|nr:hypothetical protein [Legionella massiliensis]CDZ77253.1 hypothetical protein BN59_01535 [Legionella massiliensis]CEE12991.1 hypothetical protein BN1094_01535 [Legionella massiliensis]
MTIRSLTDLKENELFVLLNQMQSQLDAEDPSVLSDRFTRSPMHAIQFLIAYAGLDEEQRRQVVAKLNQNVTKEQLDMLLDDIDWVELLNAPKRETLEFEFTIGLADRNQFLSAVRSRCPQLYKALQTKANSFVHIENADEVIFTTKIAQNEKWTKPFIREDGKSYWIVRDFRLSDAVLESLNSLQEGNQQIINGFTLRKREDQGVELHIVAPHSSNQHSIQSKLETNQGIYNAFVGLENFYGLPRVDDLRVEIESEAKFSDKGASASQTQVNTYIAESARIRKKRSIVEVNQLNVFFEGAGIVANFTDGTEKAEIFDERYYVELSTQSQENGPITLFAMAPKPLDAFLLATKQSELRPLNKIDIAFSNARNNTGATNYSFYFKCLSGLALVTGGVLLIAGLAMTNPILFSIGAVAFCAGGLSLFGLFARDGLNSSPKNENQELSLSI